MTEPEDPIAEARRLLAERTPGEWEVTYWPENVNRKCGHNDMIAVDLDIDWTPGGPSITEADAILIAAAPRLLAALCDRLEVAEAYVRDSFCRDHYDKLRGVSETCFKDGTYVESCFLARQRLGQAR